MMLARLPTGGYEHTHLFFSHDPIDHDVIYKQGLPPNLYKFSRNACAHIVPVVHMKCSHLKGMGSLFAVYKAT